MCAKTFRLKVFCVAFFQKSDKKFGYKLTTKEKKYADIQFTYKKERGVYTERSG